MTSNFEFGPYKATALWNEAVISFRDGIELSEHRHRLHKHKNSFTGSEAVRFMHKCLKTNGLFNPNVTKEQTKQLLTQFLNADLIRRAKDCSMSSEGRFRDSSKYIYQLTEKMMTFKENLPLTSINNRLRNIQSKSTIDESSSGKPIQAINDGEWKVQIINRIKDFLNPLDVSLLIPSEKIEAKWVITNGSPEWTKLKWNTELPHWILSAIHNLISCSVKSDVSETCPEFEIELFKIIADYFATLETSLICPFLFDLITNVYMYFDSLNLLILDKAESKITASQENLLECLSSPQKKSTVFDRMNVPNSCLETAFTSDDPVIRVVPQRSYDIVHLKRYSSFTTKSTYSDAYKDNIQPVTKSILKTNAKKRDRKPFQHLKIPNELNCSDYKSVSRSCYEGIDNAAFSFFSPNSSMKQTGKMKGECDQPVFPYHCFKSSPEFGRYIKSKSSDNLDNIHVYVNHGLNSSLDDSLNCDNTLDYKYAMESVNKLLKASQSKKSLTSEDTTESFHTASTSSNLDVLEARSYENINVEALNSSDALKIKWHKPIINMCISVFQLILLLIPPNHRAQLKHLMRVLHHVPLSSKELSFSQMVFQLQNVILRPSVPRENVDEKVVFHIINFIARNYEEIFSELPSNIVGDIENEISAANSKENVYCEQITGRVFEEQRIASSRSALRELLSQILENDSLSYKEKKKHLKMFKEYYPDIYNSYTKHDAKSTKNVTTKNFRL